MGQWKLDRLSVTNSDLTDAAHFGHNVHAYFRMTYTTSTFGGWTEMPLLDWHEKITYLNHRDGEWWQLDINYYATKPTSDTLKVWARRYIEAYKRAAGQPTPMMKGRSELFDKRGMAVPVAKLGMNKNTDKDRADAVRSYLKSHGGTLAIEIHDIPSIALPLTANEHAERFLFFDIGLVGGGLSVKAAQHLGVQDGVPQMHWTRNFAQGGHPGQWATRGMNKVAVPVLLTMVNNTLTQGEYM